MVAPALVRDLGVINLIKALGPPTALVDVALDTAMAGGADIVSVPAGDPIMPPFSGYDAFSDAIKLALRQTYGAMLAALAPEPWIDATADLSSPWAATGGAFQVPEYRREFPDIIRLRGSVGGGAIGTTIMTLPAGYRPPASLRIPVRNANSTNSGYVDISSAGVVQYNGTVGSGTQVDLNLTFSTTQ